MQLDQIVSDSSALENSIALSDSDDQEISEPVRQQRHQLELSYLDHSQIEQVTELDNITADSCI